MRGAGGTKGGYVGFVLGLVMMCGGFYLLLNSIVVTARFGLGYSVYSVGGYSVTSGMILIPFLFGVGLIFFDGHSMSGWLLAAGSLIALIFGVISSVNFTLRGMTAFDLLIILILAFGGVGLFFHSLAELPGKGDQ